MSESPNNLVQFRHPAEPRSIRGRPPGSFEPCAAQLLRDIERIAPSRATALIIGETGTGKELAARRIHERSGVSGPFVAVNCAALNEHLIEAELFGHEVGAFTGAQQARPGWFEAAQGGTLFLDEIGDMPLPLQVKLLRVLQEREVVRLGSRKPLAIDVRVIAATNVELPAAIKAGRFRLDLYYRLNVASIRLLPLRERRADILPLARSFIEQYSQQLGRGEVHLSPGAESALLAHAWPGNIRELENVVHRAMIVSDGPVLEAGAFLFDSLDTRATTSIRTPPAGGEELVLLTEALRRVLASEHPRVFVSAERLLVSTAFEHCDGNQVRTARRLGISRNVLRALLKRHGLLPQEPPAAGSSGGGLTTQLSPRPAPAP